MSSQLKSAIDNGMGILNGIVGDYLHQAKNPLATEMGIYLDGNPVPLSKSGFENHYPQATPNLCILIHGLTNTESIWQFKQATHLDYGKLLAQDAAYTPIYLRYNTGLSIEMNGRLLTQLLETLLQCYPTTVDQITLMGFSMGGLLIRSANHLAAKTPEHYRWPSLVKKSVYIGTPHQGASLEHFGHWVTRATGAVPKEYMKVISDLIDTRSQGIKDMRYGNISTEADPLHFSPHQEHFFISGGLSGSGNVWFEKLLGDGLVNQSSAHAKQLVPEGTKMKNQHFEGLGHLALARSPDVYTQLKEWLA